MISILCSSTTRSCVRVPVLSVQRMLIAPRFWIDGSLFTMTFFFAIARAPLARFTVTIMGSISGVSPTATDKAKSSASSHFPLVIPTIRNTMLTITSIRRIISHVKERIPLSKLLSSRRSISFFEIAPKSVLIPVETTMARAIPLVTLVPIKQALGNSIADFIVLVGRVADFSTGIDSPVKADSLTKKSFAQITLTSAGIIAPVWRSTISPGTTSDILISISTPSLST